MKAVNKHNLEKENALLISLFLFQYSLLIPVMAYISPSRIIAVSGLTLMAASILINKKLPVNLKVYAVYFVIVLAILLKAFFDGTEISVLIIFCEVAFPVLLLFSNHFDTEHFVHICIRLAIINFFVLFLNPFYGKYDYMRFGYGMVLTPVFLHYELLHVKTIKTAFRPVLWSIYVVSLFEVVAYGARGCVITFLLFFLLDTFFVHRSHIVRNFFIVIASVIAYFNIINIVDVIYQLAQKIGLFSYSLKKFRYQLQEGFSASLSGRDYLYEKAIEKIKNSPFVGNPILASDFEGNYVHNLFLQVGQDLGIFAMILLIIFLLHSIYLMWSKRVRSSDKTVLMILFSLSVGRLFFSSIIWRRPEFWMLVCFQFSIVPMVSGLRPGFRKSISSSQRFDS